MMRTAIVSRKRILEAATTVFSRYGFKRASMEDIAAEAGLSRAALYLQFRNKEDIFRELARELQEEAMVQAEKAMAAAEPLAERLRKAVEARMLRMVEIACSAHGSELMDEKNRLCGDLWVENEHRFQTMLTRLFRRANNAAEIDLAAVSLTAAEAAELFLHALSGIKGPGVTVEVYRKRLAALVRVCITGLGASASIAR
jgi:AcrR family transcriptional regulator